MDRIRGLEGRQVVLDPMAGSGTVLRQAIEAGHIARGVDVDPLAVLMSTVWTRAIDPALVWQVFNWVREQARDIRSSDPISWIDNDEETTRFVNYWFAEPQKSDLRRIAIALQNATKYASDSQWTSAIDVLRVCLSRIIITKDQGISLARDTSHSRPHKVALTSNVPVWPLFERSVKKVMEALSSLPAENLCTVEVGDARIMPHVEDSSVDLVITSPPYLNAIDYMRGHRLALVWLGYSVSQLRIIRSRSIGAERRPDAGSETEVLKMISEAICEIGSLSSRMQGVINRYSWDSFSLMRELGRVVKPSGRISLVVGDSFVEQTYVRNSAGFERAANIAGLTLVQRTERELPANQRYLPPPSNPGSALSRRMKHEVVLDFQLKH